MTNERHSSGLSPLAGATVCLTRPEGSNEAFRQSLVLAGADVVYMPLIEIRRTAFDQIAVLLARLSEYDGVIVTSANAAAIAADCARETGIILPTTTPWYAIGRATAAAAANRTLNTVELFSETGEAFATNLVQRLEGKRARMLFLRGKQARSVVPEALRSAGHEVDEVVCYETVPAMVPDDVWDAVRGANAAFVPLFSPSAVKSFSMQLMQSGTKNLYVLAIGKTTAAACKACGLDAVATAAQPTTESMVDTIIELWHQVTT